MELELAGKTVLVTGATRGIGLAIARHFSREGCYVAINGRNAEQVDAVVETMKNAVATVGDVSCNQGAKAVIASSILALGKLDIIVCNVGSGKSAPPGEETFDDWQSAFQINLLSTTNIVEHARVELEKNKGVVICISSICGSEVIQGAPVTYSSVKAALNAYIKGVSRPLGKKGVRICGIAPGNMLFEGSVWERKMRENPDAVKNMLQNEVTLAKLGTPDDVAILAVFLASPRCDFATGNIWTLDGGQIRG